MQTSGHPQRSVLIYDGDCGFCKYWVGRWKRRTGDALDYRTYQEAGSEFPSIPEKEFKTAVQLIRPDGSRLSGADAVLAVLKIRGGSGGWLGCLMRYAPGRAIARAAYAVVAANRTFFSALNRIVFERGG